jgi:hypothetical protein
VNGLGRRQLEIMGRMCRHDGWWPPNWGVHRSEAGPLAALIERGLVEAVAHTYRLTEAAYDHIHGIA